MPAHVFPRRAISTATTVTVSGLPAWLPSPGSWAQVSLNKIADEKGDHPNFSSGRNMDLMCTDFIGVAFNQYMDLPFGAYLIHGGGHQQYLGNEVYAWLTSTRKWARLTVPTYPGTNSSGTSLVTLGDWTAFKEPPFASDYLQTNGELALNVPAASHTRWHPCILPPANGGGAQGDLLIPYQSAFHTSGNGAVGQGHRFDCNASSWARFGALNSVIGSQQCWSSCVDTQRGDVWTFALSNVSRTPASTGVAASVSISGYVGSGFERMPSVYVPQVGAMTGDVIALLSSSMSVRLINPASPTSLISPTISGTPPTVIGGGAQDNNGVYCRDLGANGSIVAMDFTNKVVKALSIPTNPLSGTWTWTTLSASNTPSYGNAQWWYHRLQYAPALKSFLIATLAETSLNNGGMWCFRPSEIP